MISRPCDQNNYTWSMFISLSYIITSAGIAPDGSYPFLLRYFIYRNTDKIMNVTLNNNSSVIIVMEVANQASSAATEKTEESLLPSAVVEESGAAVEESSEVSVVYIGV